MEERIYEIFKSYCDKKELMTKDAIKEIFELIRVGWSLEDYAKELVFDDEIADDNSQEKGKKLDKTAAGLFNFKDARIIHGYKKILDVSTHLDIDEKNLFLLETLIHEFNHSIHFKEIIEDDKRFESGEVLNEDLLTTCRKDILSFNYMIDYSDPEIYALYKANYPTFTSERLCEINSFEYIKKLVYKYETNHERMDKLIDIIDLERYYWYLNGYDDKKGKVISPVSKFLKAFYKRRNFIYIKMINSVLIKDEETPTKELFKLGLKVKPRSLDNYKEYMGEIMFDIEKKRTRKKKQSKNK